LKQGKEAEKLAAEKAKERGKVETIVNSKIIKMTMYGEFSIVFDQ